MIKDVVSFLDYSLFAKVPLVLFMIAFVAITFRVLMTGKRSVDRCAALPLDEGRKECHE